MYLHNSKVTLPINHSETNTVVILLIYPNIYKKILKKRENCELGPIFLTFQITFELLNIFKNNTTHYIDGFKRKLPTKIKLSINRTRIVCAECSSHL